MTDETNVLDQLVGQVEDEALRTRLSREIELLRGSRRFGLVFDRHLPESVRLADHPIRKGVKVSLRDESTSTTWRVVRFTDTSHNVAVLDGDGGEHPISELIVVRESGEPVFPGLRTVERVANGPADAPWHTVINGENFHALQALRSTHREKVDLIYIDPPYNTGNEGWIYNDRYVDTNDRAKSSKWLSFLERRLLVARDLLKPTGVVIAAIGDEEHHRLRMLLDQIFGDQNFVANVVWQGGMKNDARFTGGGVDYMLMYARNMDELRLGPRWKEPKAGADEVIASAKRAYDEADGDVVAATAKHRAWLKGNRSRLEGVLPLFNTVVAPGRAVRLNGDLSSPNPRPNLQYDVMHPITGKPVRRPAAGWALGREAMDRAIADGRIYFPASDEVTPQGVAFLDERTEATPRPTFMRERFLGSRHLAKVLGDKRFPFPKDHEVLMRWFRMIVPSDGVILDFFGGSGTTTEAVVRLNAEDGGARQSILVTNNEVGAKTAKVLRKAGHHPGDEEWESRGVFEHVTKPRISTIVTGVRPDGSVFSDGLGANVEMFDLSYLDPGMVRRGREFASIAPLLWLEAGAVGERIEAEAETGWALTETYGVLFAIDALNAFAAAVAEAAKAGKAPRIVFVVTDSPAEYQSAGDRLPAGINTKRLYQDYLSNYLINREGAR